MNKDRMDSMLNNDPVIRDEVLPSEDVSQPPSRPIPNLKRGYPLLPVSVIQDTTSGMPGRSWGWRLSRTSPSASESSSGP